MTDETLDRTDDPLVDVTPDGKANFDDIYSQDDPRAYCAVLGELDYEVPQHGATFFGSLLPHLPRVTDRPARVLDVCCSYGFVGALLKCDLHMDDLYAHYAAMQRDGVGSAALVSRDRAFFGAVHRDEAPSVYGLDCSGPAVRYGERAGLMDRGYVEDLEENRPSPALAEALAGVDLITVTGGVGYVTEKTFGTLVETALDGGGPAPWVAAFVLRMYPYDTIVERLATLGLATEKLDGRTFVQRRFADDAERSNVLERLEEFGVDPAGKESDGSYHAELFVSRPPDAAQVAPLADLLR